MKRSILISAILVNAITAAEVAQAEQPWYVTASVGIGNLSSQDLTYRDGAVTQTAEADFDASFNGGGTLGYRFNENWRIEGEIMYRRNELAEVNLPALGTFDEGDFASLSFGLSALYDFNLFANPKVRTYVGAGVVFLQEIDIDFEDASGETSFETDDVAAQIQLGARYQLRDNWFLDAGIRYLTASGVTMEFPTDSNRTIESDYAPLSVTVGLGWRW